MTLYGSRARRMEAARLKVRDIDSQRMVIHIHGGKGNCDRDGMLSQTVLDAFREYCVGPHRSAV
jgi:integrase/recombinase XerD